MAETFASDGSGGAMKGFNGWPGVGPGSFLGSFMRPDIEYFESEVPFRVLNYEFTQDTAGDGEYRGGPGVYVVMASVTKPGHPSFLMTGNCDGMVVPARGSTGVDLEKLKMWIESPDGEKRVLRTMVTEPIHSGEVCFTKSPGGGGWGDPINRDAKKVQDDVVDGFLSIEKAKDVYGVILDPESFELKHEATMKFRKELRGKGA